MHSHHRPALRFLRLALAGLSVWLVAASASAETRPHSPPDGRLGWFAEKVRQKEPVRVGFIGGSITRGSGASQPHLAYVNRTSARLRTEIAARGGELASSVNAGVGGTGSRYGAFRVGSQILEKNVDVLVIEFAVNDARDPAAGDYLEGIIRQVWRERPRTGLVVFCTTTAAMDREHYGEGRLPPGAAAHKKVADHYGIPAVMAGPAVREKLARGEFTTEAFFPDGVHPSNLGHAFYAELLADALISALDTAAPASPPPSLPPPLGSASYEWAGMAPINPLGDTHGWTFSPPSYFHPFGRWISETPGASLRFSARGSQLGLLGQKFESAEVRIDESPAVSWSIPGRSDGIPSFRMLDRDGASAERTIEVTVRPAKAGETKVELSGVVFINPPSPRRDR